MNTVLAPIDLSPQEFLSIRNLLHDICGIHMPEGKDGLVKARLMKRLKFLQLNSFQEYIDYVKQGARGDELMIMVDELTTNKTDFFREPAHFEFLDRHILPTLQKAKKMRLWSAACSTGEEPYTLAMQILDSVQNVDQMDVRILATDISSTVLSHARDGVYEQTRLEGISDAQKKVYFTPLRDGTPVAYRIQDRIRPFITFAQLNLMSKWPMQGPFDVIFCRNVMIYFDKDTREKLVNRFYELLQPGGHLFVGHSESLSSLTHAFQYVQPAIYLK